MSASRLNPSPVELPTPENDQSPEPTDSPPAPDSAIAAYIARQAATVGRFRLPEPWVPRLRDATGKCLGRLKGEGNIAAGSVAIYPDGRTLITGDAFGSIGCWNLADGGKLRPFQGQHSAQIQDIAFSPNGRWLATASSDNTIRIWSTATRQELLCCEGHSKEVLKIGWSPDSIHLVSASTDKSVRVWNALSGACRHACWGHEEGVYSVAWSPDGHWLASGSRDRSIRIWDANSGACLHRLWTPDGATESVSWSPDSRWLATAGEDNTIRLWDSRTWELARAWKAHPEAHYLSCLAWSPDGRFLASGAHGDKTVGVWETTTGERVERFDFPESYTWRLAWSPDGGFLASKHAGAVCRLWDTRSLRLAGGAAGKFLSAELAFLPGALAQLQRLRLYPPLALLRELLRLTGGQLRRHPLSEPANSPGMQEMIRLHWPPPARIGLVAFLLQGIPLDEWQPPPGLTPGQLQEVLASALTGKARNPSPCPYPLAPLRQNAARVDDRLLALLTLLGPEAVAADPGLPLRLYRQAPTLPALSAPQRRLLALRLPLDRGRHAQGGGMASARTGITRQGNLQALLPSQLALPPLLLHSRYQRQELLYRARSGQEPPRLRPTVLVLDVSPASFGPVGLTSRLAAHVIAASLLQAHLPVTLLAAGGAGQVRLLEQPADLLELWLLRSLEPAPAGHTLRLARTLHTLLRDNRMEPVIVLLSHPWFGAEETVSAIPSLRGLFVQYPGQQIRPALARACERWESVGAGQVELDVLAKILG